MAAKLVVTPALLGSINSGLQTAFNKGQVGTPEYANRLNLMTVKSTTSEELYGWLADLPELEKNKDEITWNPVELQGQVIVNDEFKVGIKIPRKAIEDDKYGMFSQVASKLGQNGKASPDYDFLALLPLLFTTIKAYTGKTFFATDHKLNAKAAAFSNKTTKKLSAANFQDAYAALRGMKKATGQPLFTLLDPSKVFLLVGENYEATADGIVKLAKLANGGDNPNFNKAQVVVIPGLGDAWMLFDCSDMITPVIFQDRIPLELTAATSFTDEAVLNADEFKWKARRRFAWGPGDPRRAFGSTGADPAEPIS